MTLKQVASLLTTCCASTESPIIVQRGATRHCFASWVLDGLGYCFSHSISALNAQHFKSNNLPLQKRRGCVPSIQLPKFCRDASTIIDMFRPSMHAFMRLCPSFAQARHGRSLLQASVNTTSSLPQLETHSGLMLVLTTSVAVL